MFGIVYKLMGQQQIAGYPWFWELAVIFFTFLGFGMLGLYDDVMKIFGYAKQGFFGKVCGINFAAVDFSFDRSGNFVLGLGIDFINIPSWGIVHLGWIYFFIAAF